MTAIFKHSHSPIRCWAIALLTAICLPALAAAASPARQLDVIVILQGNGESMRNIPAADVLSRHIDNRARAANLAAEHGVSARHTYGTVMRGFSARINERQLERLQQDSRVARVELDGVAWATRGKPDRGGSQKQVVPWGIDRIGIRKNTGTGVHVYVLDSGIDSNHPDLEGNIDTGWAGYACKGKKCIYDWDDDNGHGTHVAGTIGAQDNEIGVVGVAPDVSLHAVKVLHKSGSGAWSVIAAGVDWAAMDMATRGEVAVANMSIGGYDTKNGACTESGFTGSGALHQAICNAKNTGLVIAVAAGNSGADSQGEIPAAFDDSVITVSATMEGDDWIGWSNWGDDTAAWTSHASAPVTIAAPGVSVLSTYNNGGTATYSGTSMASPHVAGAIALYLVANPQQILGGTAFTNARAALLSNAESTAGFSNSSGHPHDEGFLNINSF